MVLHIPKMGGPSDRAILRARVVCAEQIWLQVLSND